MSQPLSTPMTQRQAINTGNFAESSYASIRENFKATNIAKLVTLGFSAALLRNLCLLTAVLPKSQGNESLVVDAGFAAGAVLVSHPFEVARVLIVCQEKNRFMGSTFSTLQSLYGAEGIAGLYRGFVPRAVTLMPILFTTVYVSDKMN